MHDGKSARVILAKRRRYLKPPIPRMAKPMHHNSVCEVCGEYGANRKARQVGTQNYAFTSIIADGFPIKVCYRKRCWDAVK